MTNTVTMDANRTVTVEFGLAYSLSASVVGGNGNVSPTSGTYVQGKVITLTATPDSGYQVKSWSGTDDDTSTETTNTVTMDANHTVTVEFESTTGCGCFTKTEAGNRVPYQRFSS